MTLRVLGALDPTLNYRVNTGSAMVLYARLSSLVDLFDYGSHAANALLARLLPNVILGLTIMIIHFVLCLL
jgi:hypothetical protein